MVIEALGRQLVRSTIRPALRRFGIEISGVRKVSDFASDLDAASLAIIDRVDPFTMTGLERIVALVDAVKYLDRAGIPGALVECGVWKGGSAMTMALTSILDGRTDRELYLYDTFSGMSAPSEADVSVYGLQAQDKFDETRTSSDSSTWCEVSMEEVRSNVASTGYPLEQTHLIKGKVEDTIPGTIPSEVALLRLDTDWYESTKHELEHLYPLLSMGGVVIVDDYGHWKGSRRAVDEYFSDRPTFFHRVDYSCRLAIKTQP